MAIANNIPDLESGNYIGILNTGMGFENGFTLTYHLTGVYDKTWKCRKQRP